MRPRRRARFGILLVTALATGCGAPPRAETPFLRSVDLIDMTDRMAESIASAPAVVARRPTDEPWIISINRISNHTNQIIPEREKWLYVARLRGRLAPSNLARERHLIWVIPTERWAIVAAELPDASEPYGLRLDPTHQLTGEFLALTTTSGSGRTDAYLCSYQLVDLEDGSIIWEDQWEVQRAIRGRSYD